MTPTFACMYICVHIIIPYGTKLGKILTNGSCVKFDEQTFDKFTVVKVIQRKRYKEKI